MKNSKLILAAVLLLSAWACEPDIAEGFETFVIPQGEHYCLNRHTETLQKRSLEFRARFDSSAIYVFDDPGFQDSKNKLMGFSDCNAEHHENSARFAWQWYNDRIEIYAYCYVNSERVEQFLGWTAIGAAETYRLEIGEDYYMFDFKDSHVIIPRGNTCQTGAYFMLWPYFGGQLSAPHQITIDISRF